MFVGDWKQVLARLLKQDPVLRREFKERINKKVQNKKEQMKREMDEELPAVAAWVAKPLAGLFFDRINAKNMEKGDAGEFNVFLQAKMRLSDEWFVFNDVVVEPEPGRLTQIDHIIIGPPGLFIIETKAWKGSYSAYKDNWKYRNGTEWIKCKSSPTKQNTYHVKAIAEWLKGTKILSIDAPAEKWIVPIVVFTRAQWLKTTDCSMPVFNGISEFIAYLKAKAERYLGQDDIERLTALIQYPTLSKALRQDQIKWFGASEALLLSDATENNQDTSALEVEERIQTKVSSVPEYTEGVTKNGKRYVRIVGTMEQATMVYEHFRTQHPDLKPPRKDRFKEGMFFFYIS